jgi:hypothetical protein
MYDAIGRFTFMIMRSDLPKFVSNIERKQLRKKVRLWPKV